MNFTVNTYPIGSREYKTLAERARAHTHKDTPIHTVNKYTNIHTHTHTHTHTTHTHHTHVRQVAMKVVIDGVIWGYGGNALLYSDYFLLVDVSESIKVVLESK